MKSLVVYYSRTNITKKLAETIAGKTDADIEELIPKVNYNGKIGVEAVDARDILPDDLIEHAALTEHPRDRAAEHRPQNERQALHIDGELQLVRLVHPDAVVVAGRKLGQKLRPEAEAHVLHLDGVVLTHRDDLFAQCHHVARLIQRKNVTTQDLDIILTPLNEMGLDGIALIAHALDLDDAADVIGDVTLLPLVSL